MPPPPDADFTRLFVNALAARTSPTKQVLVISKKAPALSSSSSSSSSRASAVSSSPPSSSSSASSSPRASPALLSLDPVVFISRRKAVDGSELYFVGLPEVNRSLPRLSDTAAHSSHSSSPPTSSASAQQHDQLLERYARTTFCSTVSCLWPHHHPPPTTHHHGRPCVTATLCLLEDIANFASIYEPPYVRVFFDVTTMTACGGVRRVCVRGGSLMWSRQYQYARRKPSTWPSCRCTSTASCPSERPRTPACPTSNPSSDSAFPLASRRSPTSRHRTHDTHATTRHDTHDTRTRSKSAMLCLLKSPRSWVGV